MHTSQCPCRPLAALILAATLAALPALADTTIEPNTSSTTPVYSPAPAGPSVNNEKYRALKETCDKDGKGSPEACLDAAALLVGGDLPDEFRETKEDQRIKIALRLLEKAVDSSNLARGRAFDYYDKVGFLGMSTYADPYRAKELMDMMNKSDYPGASLRKIRSQTTILSFGASEAEKRAACAEAKRMLKEIKLDADSAKIARDVVGSGVCTGYDAPPVK